MSTEEKPDPIEKLPPRRGQRVRVTGGPARFAVGREGECAWIGLRATGLRVGIKLDPNESEKQAENTRNTLLYLGVEHVEVVAKDKKPFQPAKAEHKNPLVARLANQAIGRMRDDVGATEEGLTTGLLEALACRKLVEELAEGETLPLDVIVEACRALRKAFR